MIKALSPEVLATLKYVQAFSGRTIVIKLGGSILQDDELLSSICQDLASIRNVGVQTVLVHGGGPAINQELERRGIKWEFVNGLRVTTPEMMDVIEMVLCGTVNRRIVKALGRMGLKPIGLSGVDAASILCRRADKNLGRVGEIERINTSWMKQILASEDELGHRSLPVIAPIGFGRDGLTYNINADWVASRVASALGVTKMVFLSDQDGILDSRGQMIPELDAGELEQLIEDGVVSGGMLAKTKTILHAVKNGVTDVHIINGRRPNVLVQELFTDYGAGTVCRLRSRGQTDKKWVNA